jgi:hypothetical protein
MSPCLPGRRVRHETRLMQARNTSVSFLGSCGGERAFPRQGHFAQETIAEAWQRNVVRWTWSWTARRHA